MGKLPRARVFAEGRVRRIALPLLAGLTGGLMSAGTAAADPPLQTCDAAQVRASERFWFFGEEAGIDFGTSGTTATALNIGVGTSQEGTTVATDTTGQLLFWSNGLNVFNRNHEVMPHGDGLFGNFSATQPVSAFPSLTQPGVYFVVVTSAGAPVGGELYYSVVDMSLEDGLGDVTDTKNVQLGEDETSSEALTAVPNANGTGFWVLTFTMDSPNVLAYEFDGDGPLTGEAVTSAMSTNHGNRFGTFNFSADLTQLAMVSGGNNGNSVVRLLDFDAATGQMTEIVSWSLPAGSAAGHDAYSADFSPSGDWLYATRIFGGSQLYRYDIATYSTEADLEANVELVGSPGKDGGQVRRAPDGRMYVANNNEEWLSVVNDPDAVDLADVDFVVEGFFLASPSTSRFGLPQTVACGLPLTPAAPAALAVDPAPLASDSNGVFEPGEQVEVAPAWRNDHAASLDLQGSAASFTGPGGADYTLVVDEANYGLVDPAETASCRRTGICYRTDVNDPAERPARHWDATIEETLDDEFDTTKTWTLHLGDSFADVPSTSPFYGAIETLLHSEVTLGCTATEYCPGGANTRAQMAIFLLKSLEGAEFTPPTCEGIFDDVPCPSIFADWIEELASRNVTSGCTATEYCPGDAVTRAQMAIFLLKTLEGAEFTPPKCNSAFDDVPCPSLFADWIEELATREITSGCSMDPPQFCPADPVTRAQMAVFLTRTFELVLYGP